MNVGFTDLSSSEGMMEKTLHELIVDAKGKNRSMKEFAEVCGINPSTLSRITGEKQFASKKVLLQIARFAEKGSGVTLEALDNANNKLKLKAGTNQKRTEESAHAQIILNLVSSGYGVGISEKASLSLNESFAFKTDYTYVVIDSEREKQTWLFEYMGFNTLQELVGIMSNYSLALKNDPVGPSRLVLTIITNGGYEIEEKIKRIQGIRFDTDITVLVYDADTETIRAEIPISASEGEAKRILVLSSDKRTVNNNGEVEE